MREGLDAERRTRVSVSDMADAVARACMRLSQRSGLEKLRAFLKYSAPPLGEQLDPRLVEALQSLKSLDGARVDAGLGGLQEQATLRQQVAT